MSKLLSVLRFVIKAAGGGLASEGRTRAILLGLGLVLRGVRPVVGEQIDFVRDVRPILEQHCYGCHGADQQKSSLRLDIRTEAFKGGELYGASLIPYDAERSPLIQFVATDNSDLRMPPEGDRLAQAQIDLLTKWVNQGAQWPEGVDRAKTEDRRDHWSFQPLQAALIPPVRQVTWPRNEIDFFVLSKLEEEGLGPAPEAAPADWLRRVTLDLTGLPPTPEQISEFLTQPAEDAYERIVEGLLASPRYGERQAQHWLDVVRFADTHGFEVNTERPHAWHFRDYVIRAFNDDQPYDRFIRDQLTGDQHGQDAATGFLVTASLLLPGQIGQDDPSKRLARQDALDEVVANISLTFLGLSIGCARCHEHKFDPISQADYYAMQSFVAGIEYGVRDLSGPEAARIREEIATARAMIAELDDRTLPFIPLANSTVRRPAVNSRLNVERFAPVTTRKVRFTIGTTSHLEPCIDEFEVFNTVGNNIALQTAGARVTSSGDTVTPNVHELGFLNDGAYGNSSSWVSSEAGKGWLVLEFPEPQQIVRISWGRDRVGEFSDRVAIEYHIEVADEAGNWQRIADHTDRIPYDPAIGGGSAYSPEEISPEARLLFARQANCAAKLRRGLNSLKVFAGLFRQPDGIHLLTRGDPEQPKQQVFPAVPEFLGAVHLDSHAPEPNRRSALVAWLTDPRHPLTARVMVNRIWQAHFGTGLVETPSDFGRTGMSPTHPHLLDWLAAEFIHERWSIKAMQRRIVLSATYRQASRQPDLEQRSEAERRDADVRLLWRYPSRRLDAESIRDSMLFVAGTLNPAMYGRGFDLFRERGGLTGFTPRETFDGEGLKRMIYAHRIRRERDPVFGAFDCPDFGQSAAVRSESTTPIQALNLFNSRFTLDQAEALAMRLRQECGTDLVAQILRMYQLTCSRSPSAGELRAASAFVGSHGLPALCRVLFNSNEFLFLP